MTEPGDRDEQIAKLQADVAGLRARLRRVEQDSDAARTLAAVADRDVGDIGSEFRTFRDQNNRLLSAMRADLADVRTEMRTEFAAVRTEIADVRTEMRTEFADVRTEMRTEFADVRAEMHTEFADVRAEMHTEFADVRAEMRQGFATATAGQQQIVVLLESLTQQNDGSGG